jgi:hypothetical protein
MTPVTWRAWEFCADAAELIDATQNRPATNAGTNHDRFNLGELPSIKSLKRFGTSLTPSHVRDVGEDFGDLVTAV